MELLALLIKAIAAVNWAISGWNKRNFCFLTARCASHFSEFATCFLFCLTASWATLWRCETFLRVKLLLSGSKFKLLSAVLTSEVLTCSLIVRHKNGVNKLSDETVERILTLQNDFPRKWKELTPIAIVLSNPRISVSVKLRVDVKLSRDG
jgi:hypothetical protein